MGFLLPSPPAREPEPSQRASLLLLLLLPQLTHLILPSSNPWAPKTVISAFSRSGVIKASQVKISPPSEEQGAPATKKKHSNCWPPWNFGGHTHPFVCAAQTVHRVSPNHQLGLRPKAGSGHSVRSSASCASRSSRSSCAHCEESTQHGVFRELEQKDLRASLADLT